MSRCRRHSAAALLSVFVAAVVAVPIAAAAPARATDRAAWCAAVIKINTRFGTMKNKRYIQSALSSPAKRQAVVRYAVAHKAHILAITPKEIKKAQIHELTFYANLVENDFATSTPLAPFTFADSTQLLDYQHEHCGITGP